MTCSRCQGLLLVNHGETYCPNCGHRPYAYLPFNVPVLERGRCRYCQRKTLKQANVCWFHKQYHIQYKRQQHLKELREAKRRRKEDLCAS